MAGQDDAQEKTERASPKRLQDAREKGQIARSRELTTMFVLLGGVAALKLSGTHLVAGMSAIMQAGLALTREDLYSTRLLPGQLLSGIVDALLALAPLLVAATLIALVAPLALGGWSFSGTALLPKLERLDPIKGLGRVLGLRGVIEMLKAAAKFCLILVFAVVALRHEQVAILGLARENVMAALADGVDILFFVFVLASLATILIALVDVPYQLWDHGRKLRMSRQDLRDEMKETDGSPELKGRVRGMQHELARRRMMEQVPSADVVVTNPEHYAVALRFDAARMRAPIVVAKGVEEVAANIRALATAHGVTLLAAPPLARALYHTTKLDHEIPAGLYLAVARVLAYVFQLRAGNDEVSPPVDLPVPTELAH